MGTYLTVCGLVLSALGASVIALFEPDPTDIVQQIHGAFPDTEFPATSFGAGILNGLSWMPRRLVTSPRETQIRRWCGWGVFVVGVLLQIAGELVQL